MTLALQRASYRYAGGIEPAVRSLDLTVSPGELVVLTGPTGCGKSTLLRLASGLAGRHGQGVVEGAVLVNGADPVRWAPSVRVGEMGFVTQTPSDQLVAGTVGDEVAFGPESAGMDRQVIERRVERMLSLVKLEVALERSPRALSGGQQQRLVVAAALSGGAQLLLLDEPTSQLDPLGAQGLMARLREWADRGHSVVVAEHRLETCLAFADRVWVMDHGRVVADACPSELDMGLLKRLGLQVPGLVDLSSRLRERGLTPELARFRVPVVAPPPPSGSVLIRAEALRWQYRDTEGPALDGVDFQVARGERVAVLGANGSGKSTLLALLSGQLSTVGVDRVGSVVDVPQNPDLALFCASVLDELAHGPREQRCARQEVMVRVEKAAQALGVDGLLGQPPQALSRGQRLRVAVAAALSCAPDVLILDEPTSGQDRGQVQRMMLTLREDGKDRGLVFATHDMDLALAHSTRVVVLDAGRVVAEGKPAEVIARLPDSIPLRLPPLAAWCLERGLPAVSAVELIALLAPEES